MTAWHREWPPERLWDRLGGREGKLHAQMTNLLTKLMRFLARNKESVLVDYSFIFPEIYHNILEGKNLTRKDHRCPEYSIFFLYKQLYYSIILLCILTACLRFFPTLVTQ